MTNNMEAGLIMRVWKQSKTYSDALALVLGTSRGSEETIQTAVQTCSPVTLLRLCGFCLPGSLDTDRAYEVAVPIQEHQHLDVVCREAAPLSGDHLATFTKVAFDVGRRH